MHVSAEDLERNLDIVRARAAGPREGLFGPASVTWRVNREAAVFLGAGRALLLQLAHPWVSAAIADHSNVLDDPLGRFHRTFKVMFTMVFGTADQALAASRALYRRHVGVVGVLSEPAGPFVSSSPYQANDVAALRWVHATLMETAVLAHDLVLPPLTEEAREQYWSEAKLFAGLFGIPSDSLPMDWKSFVAYTEEMAASDELTVTTAARDIVRHIFSGGATHVRPPLWYRALTAEMLPARLRTAFELPFAERDHCSADRALAVMRRLYPLLPDRLRTVGPYQEAQARLRGRDRPSMATQWLNRLWIGQPSMGHTAPTPHDRL
jgi:uncharacterized protein (DUF2236 family)